MGSGERKQPQVMEQSLGGAQMLVLNDRSDMGEKDVEVLQSLLLEIINP